MDNLHIDVTSEGNDSLRLVMMLAFRRNTKATHYAVTEKHGLLLFWMNPGQTSLEVKSLPFKLDAEGAADFAQRWLAEADYGKEPDHDGSNGRGWRISTDNWGRGGGYDYGIVAIQPAWAMYGK